jgi:uncharacterized protein (DUF4415 family)
MPKLKPGTKTPAPEEDAAINEGIAADPTNPEWLADDNATARPAAAIFKDLGMETPRPRGRGPQKTPTKEPVALRLDRDVLEHFRATGRGWQGRMNDALKEWVREHK